MLFDIYYNTIANDDNCKVFGWVLAFGIVSEQLYIYFFLYYNEHRILWNIIIRTVYLGCIICVFS